MYSQVQPTVWVTRDTLGVSSMPLATTLPSAQPTSTNTTFGPATSSGANSAAAVHRAAVMGASVHQCHILTVTSTQSVHENHTMSSALRGANNGATARACPEPDPLENDWQAALRVDRVDSLTVERHPDPSREIDSGIEPNLVYQLRGVPYAATARDVAHFLRTVHYCRLDIGVLSTGESSGNAFVELDDRHAAQELMRVHNRIIAVAADAWIPAHHRPRPRYVEVFRSNSAKRDAVLCEDASKKRRSGPNQRGGRASAVSLATVRNPIPDSVTHNALSQTLRPPTQPPQPLLLHPHSPCSVLVVAASVAQQHEVATTVLPNRTTEVSRFTDVSFSPTNIYEENEFHRQHNPSMALSNIMDTQAAHAHAPSALVACEPSRAPSASYQSISPINPQAQSLPQRSSFSPVGFNIVLVPADPSLLATINETRSPPPAPLSHPHATPSGCCYYLTVGRTIGPPPPLSPF